MDMQIITKKDFTDIITSKESCHFGIMNRAILSYEELEKAIIDFGVDKLCETFGVRTAIKEGKYIKFSNGSRLDIGDTKIEKTKCYIYRFPFATILATECSWYDRYDEGYRYKSLYYIIK